MFICLNCHRSTNVAFGKLVDGRSVLEFLNGLFVDQNDKPFSKVIVANSGELQLKEVPEFEKETKRT
jgi:hypothetical protein